MATVKYAAVWAGWRGGRRWALEADRGLEPVEACRLDIKSRVVRHSTGPKRRPHFFLALRGQCVHSKHDISIARGGLFQNAGKEGREEGRKDLHLAFVQHTARRDPPVYHITNHCIYIYKHCFTSSKRSPSSSLQIASLLRAPPTTRFRSPDVMHVSGRW